MKIGFVFVLFFGIFVCYSQDTAFNQTKKIIEFKPDVFHTEKIGVIPNYISIITDKRYHKVSKEESLLIKKYDSIINYTLSSNLKVDFIKYTNIDERLVTNRIGWLTGSIEHGHYKPKSGFPRKLVKINPERYQIGLSWKSYPINNSNRNFVFLFVFDRLSKKTIGYKQISFDNFPIYNYKAASEIISQLVIYLNSLISRN